MKGFGRGVGVAGVSLRGIGVVGCLLRRGEKGSSLRTGVPGLTLHLLPGLGGSLIFLSRFGVLGVGSFFLLGSVLFLSGVLGLTGVLIG